LHKNHNIKLMKNLQPLLDFKY